MRDAGQYEAMLARLQRLRGSVYLEDGAITAQDLSVDGRHLSLFDEKAWHVLSVEGGNRVLGCARYLPHAPTASFDSLSVVNSALAHDPQWAPQLRSAVEAQMKLAEAKQVAYSEVGGWAIEKSVRCTGDALRLALALYALSRRLGGCIGLTTATVRHRSAATLQKIGGSILDYNGERLPYYFDPQYSCEMAILRFQSDQANRRFESWIQCLEVQLRTAPVLYAAPRAAAAYQPEYRVAAAPVAERRKAVAMA